MNEFEDYFCDNLCLSIGALIFKTDQNHSITVGSNNDHEQ